MFNPKKANLKILIPKFKNHDENKYSKKLLLKQTGL